MKQEFIEKNYLGKEVEIDIGGKPHIEELLPKSPMGFLASSGL